MSTVRVPGRGADQSVRGGAGAVHRAAHGPGRLRGPVAALAAIAVAAVLPFVVPGWVGLLVVVGVFFLVVLGLDLLTGLSGQVSLGQTLFMALGGYGAGLLTLRLHWPTALATVVMALVSALVAAGLGTTLLRLRGYYLALATLGLAVITESLASGLGDLTGGPSGLVAVPSLQLGGWTVFSDRANYYVLLVVCAAGAWFVAGIQRGGTGRALSAVAADTPAAAMLGIDTARYKTRAFVASAVFASVAGSLYTFYLRFISPDVIGVTVAFSVVIMLALGGSRTLVGPLLGALVLQGLPQAGQTFSRWEPLVAGIVLIVVMTYFPRGLWGTAKALARRRSTP
ncbi:branched-chain amino acid ABC transporter permease [Streptomyces sulfonofaciens]|uniref:Branched-chain amino acid ABC transporter permease n=1 Tax=Streptomyces sulfonofaciens TaxID=68272 RepID=A0A919L557_9ACTN|nr:branched-chain amino acid ABC transporter permease [Streptomyces sulfonofaciens]GHH84207.1 branched-chain amino acid ABC transporter permease [Streptomyces sulfonofaciens]